MKNKLIIALLGLILITPKIDAMATAGLRIGQTILASSIGAGLMHILQTYPATAWMASVAAPAVQVMAPAIAPVAIAPAANPVISFTQKLLGTAVTGAVGLAGKWCWEHRTEIALSLESMKNNIGFYLVNKKLNAIKKQNQEELDAANAHIANLQDQVVTLTENHNQLREDHNQLVGTVNNLTSVVSEIKGQEQSWYQKLAHIFRLSRDNNNNQNISA